MNIRKLHNRSITVDRFYYLGNENDQAVGQDNEPFAARSQRQKVAH